MNKNHKKGLKMVFIQVVTTHKFSNKMLEKCSSACLLSFELMHYCSSYSPALSLSPSSIISCGSDSSAGTFSRRGFISLTFLFSFHDQCWAQNTPTT